MDKDNTISARRALGYCLSKDGNPSRCNEKCFNLMSHEMGNKVDCHMFFPHGAWNPERRYQELI